MSDLQTSRFRVEGMDCAACGAKVEAAVRRVEGVHDVNISVTTGAMSISHLPQTNTKAIAEAVKRVGYKAKPEADDTHSHYERTDSGPWWKSRRALLTVACGLALVGAYGVGRVFPTVEAFAFLAALGIGLVPIAKRAFNAARVGMPFSIESLMTIAAVGAVVIGATEEAAMVVFLFLVGEMLEGVAAARARASIHGLSDLIPKTALLIENSQTKEVPASELKVGAKVLVRPGDRIAADGVILEGESEVNEAPVTGESIPKRKRADDNVFAGTINGEAALTIRVTAAASDNTIARVIRLVEEAQESKAPTERFIDRFSKYYTPAVVVFAAAVATLLPLLGFGGWDEWIYKGLAVLLIGCPCALVISTPAAIASALSSGARRGLLLKGGAVLEQLGSLTTIAFDKTGTLTTAKAIAGKGVSANVGGEIAFLGSPQSVAEYAQLSENQKSCIVTLNDEGKTVSVLVVNKQVAGLLALRDEPREDAKAGLQRLKDLGIKTLMLTGDNKRTAQAIGQTLGIEPRGELLPQDKMDIVAQLKKSGEVVGKVGDGINDAPALAAADVGIAMGGGTDVALETADAAVLHGRVSDVANMIDLSKRTMRNIRQNITIALGLKAVFLATTVMGITGLWPAILADTGATVLVTANAMRLLRDATPK